MGKRSAIKQQYGTLYELNKIWQIKWKTGKSNNKIRFFFSLLSQPSSKEKADKQQRDEILELLSKPTTKEKNLMDTFKSQSGTGVKEFCTHSTKIECMKINGSPKPCERLHFKRIIQPHTDQSLGDCSFLNTCFHMDTCKVTN